jgi:CYTH domain-containing protein
MPREIERKYRVNNDAWRQLAEPGIPYRQGYLCTEPARSVRIRVAGGHAFLTIKGASAGAGHDEFEYPIPTDDAEHLLRELCVLPLIEKTRYVIHDGKLKWEIDEFEGENRGLVIAEVELTEEAQDIRKPDWLGIEVTDDPRYYNLSLVKRPYTKWHTG